LNVFSLHNYKIEIKPKAKWNVAGELTYLVSGRFFLLLLRIANQQIIMNAQQTTTKTTANNEEWKRI